MSTKQAKPERPIPQVIAYTVEPDGYISLWTFKSKSSPRKIIVARIRPQTVKDLAYSITAQERHDAALAIARKRGLLP
jgi:hypothetical protein